MSGHNLRREASPISFISIRSGQGRNQSHLFKPAIFFIIIMATVLFIPAHAEIIAVTLVGYYDTPYNAYSISVSGNYAYIGNSSGLCIIDISNLDSLYEAGSYDTPTVGMGVTMSGNLAYVADYNHGLRIINITNPASMSEVGYYDTPGQAHDVVVSGNYAYVADDTSGLRIVNVTNPASPSEVGYCDTLGHAYKVAVSGEYAYVADFGNGLRIINISNPALPTEAGYYDTPGYAYGVAVSGEYAYVADFGNGLRIIDISNPSSPFEVGYYDTPGSARDVAVSGNYAYVADGIFSGLRIINISNPTLPYEVGYYNCGSANGIAVSGNYIYVTAYDEDLYILNCNLVTPTPTLIPTITPTPIPVVMSLSQRYSLTNSQIRLSVQGRDFSGISAIKLKNSSRTVIGSFPEVAGNSLTAWFSLGTVPGLFDLVLGKGAMDFVFKTIFTVLSSQSGPVRWKMNDLGKAGNPPAPGTSAIAIGDADCDGQAEVYVANNEHMIFKYKKTVTWSTTFLPEVSGSYFSDLIIADANHDGDWEIIGACSEPMAYQYQADGTGWNANSVCPVTGPLAVGDGNNDGLVDVYGVSLNASADMSIVEALTNSPIAADLGTIYCLVAGDGDNDQADEVYAANHDKRVFQFKYNGSSWDKTIVAIVGDGEMKVLVLGDMDKDGNNELYGANEDKNIYQFKCTGLAWSSKSINTLPGACRALAISDGDNDGNDEIYIACADGHVYQLRLNGTQWQQQDLGNAGTPLLALAVGDGDNNFQFEVYAVGENAHVYQFQAKGNDSTPTPTITSIAPDKFLKIYQSQINPNRGEEARITWSQPQSGPVTIIIYNLLGEKVVTLADHKEYHAGRYNEVVWKGITQAGRAVGSGIYIVHIKAGDWQDKAKICVVK